MKQDPNSHTKHPHHDVILAYLNGQDVQFKPLGSDDWVDCKKVTALTPLLPGFNIQNEYRIKPKTKKCRVALMTNKDTGNQYPACYYCSKASAVESLSTFVRWLSDVIEYEETI